jgi:hypothetical protein
MTANKNDRQYVSADLPRASLPYLCPPCQLGIIKRYCQQILTLISSKTSNSLFTVPNSNNMPRRIPNTHANCICLWPAGESPMRHASTSIVCALLGALCFVKVSADGSPCRLINAVFLFALVGSVESPTHGKSLYICYRPTKKLELDEKTTPFHE